MYLKPEFKLQKALFALIISISVPFFTKASSLISPLQDSVLYEILNLKPKTARKMLDSGKATGFSLYNEYLYNWNEALELCLSGNEEKFKKFQEGFDERIERIEAKANQNSPSYHVILADIYIHAAMVNIMNNNYLSGFGKLMKANKNIRLNEEKHPGYWQNNKLAGALNVSFASLSPFWRKIAGVFNLTGDAEKGFGQLEKYLVEIKTYRGLHAEAVLYYGAVLKIAKDDERAWKMIEMNLKKENTPALTAFLASNILHFTNRNEEALQYLGNFPVNKIEIPFYHFDYLMGKEKLSRLDADADFYLKKFLEKTGLKSYKREICLKLAHHCLIQGDMTGYELYLKKMDEYPKASIDRDREADIEKNIGYQPDINLLKSRYLAWGGYWNKTDSVLQLVNQKMLQPKSQKNEYSFLLASVRNAQNRQSEALLICDQLITTGKQDKDRFPAEAALLAGNICFNKNNFEKADFYFNQTLKIEGNDDVYIEIIHRRAKNQLEKLKKK
jgi:hypothetical protein